QPYGGSVDDDALSPGAKLVRTGQLVDNYGPGGFRPAKMMARVRWRRSGGQAAGAAPWQGLVRRASTPSAWTYGRMVPALWARVRSSASWPRRGRSASPMSRVVPVWASRSTTVLVLAAWSSSWVKKVNRAVAGSAVARAAA